MSVIEKNAVTSGADEKTPSRAQYFSWINNTNEGSTQQQTLINLEYFKWLRDTYNMQLDIYAWDAGNLDGASGTYEKLDGEKLKKQFPDGYGPVSEAARKLGTRLGVWCGPDGFGDTPESERERTELMVGLCRDYHFGLFKMDSVCGNIREDKIDAFIDMMKQCRKYSPDLILLNHRLRLGKAEPYATTYLLDGAETYVDVHICNDTTAPHHRAFVFHRECAPGLMRLTEDHGVCLSSCLDYFEDDLIYQAFGRCLILSPEIYGNPWLLRDDEQAHLARIFNLHRQFRDILVDGIKLSEDSFGENSVSRGSGSNRFIVTGNCTWKKKKISVRLDRSIGLEPCEKVFVAAHHPFEKVYGEYCYGDTVDIRLMPFRALLLQVCDVKEKPAMLSGCEYEVLHEDANGVIDKVKLVRTAGIITLPDGRTIETAPVNSVNRVPIYMGAAYDCPIPENVRELIEAAYYAVDPDSLEARSLKRSGPTSIPQVEAAREAFFSQRTYRLRGCENRWAFDGNKDTFFDAMSKIEYGGMRVKGGCLRVDFGDVYEADCVLVEYFDPDEPDNISVSAQNVAQTGEFAQVLSSWRSTGGVVMKTVSRESIDCVVHSVNNIKSFAGRRRQALYQVDGPVRYFQIPEPPERIFRLALIKDGEELALSNPRATNLMPSYKNIDVSAAQSMSVTVSDCLWRKNCYLSVAVNGEHGDEGVTAVACVDGKLYGCPDRAPSYKSNVFEYVVTRRGSNYTYYLPVLPEMVGKMITIYILYTNGNKYTLPVEVCLCDSNCEKQGVILNEILHN